MWCQKKDNKTFKNLAAFERTKLLNGEEIEAKGKASINKKLSNAGRNSQLTVEEGGYKSFFSEIYNKIITSDCLKVLKDENYVFPEEHKEEADEENNYLSQITEDIQYRQKPKLTNIQEVKARKVAKTNDFIRIFKFFTYFVNTNNQLVTIFLQIFLKKVYKKFNNSIKNLFKNFSFLTIFDNILIHLSFLLLIYRIIYHQIYILYIIQNKLNIYTYLEVLILSLFQIIVQ